MSANIERGGAGAPSGAAWPVTMVGVYFARTGIGLLAPKPLLKNLGTGSRVIPLRLFAAMGKQFTAAELYRTHWLKAQGGTPTEVHSHFLAKQRSSPGRAGPDLTSVRRMRATAEPRGRCRSLTPITLRALGATRNLLLKEAGGEPEIHWGQHHRCGANSGHPPRHLTSR